MMKKKNPIEKAIGKRAENPPQVKLSEEELKKVAGDVKQAVLKKNDLIHSGEEPTPQEMTELEKLQQKTTELVGDEYPDSPMERVIEKPKTPPAPKPENQTATMTSSQESLEAPEINNHEIHRSNFEKLALKESSGYPQKFTEEDVKDAQAAMFAENELRMKQACKQPTEDEIAEKTGAYIDKYGNGPELDTVLISPEHPSWKPAEEPELAVIRDYILSNGFNVAMVAMHLSVLCAQPTVVPSTTTWAMPHWERIPDMVYKTLTTPGFLENIYPALKVVMGSNIGNTAWSSEIAITFAFFGIIQTLPYVLEMEKNEG